MPLPTYTRPPSADAVLASSPRATAEESLMMEPLTVADPLDTASAPPCAKLDETAVQPVIVTVRAPYGSDWRHVALASLATARLQRSILQTSIPASAASP